MFKRGFTLIELMVVIAIVAIVAAASMGAYKQYSLRAKVSKALAVVDIYAQEALKEFELTGAFPSSMEINGVNAGCTWSQANAYVNLTDQHINWFSFCSNASSGYIQFTFTLSGLDGVTGYAEANSTSVTTGTADMLSYALRLENDGTYSVECGHYDAAADSVPFAYLPSSCQCANVQPWAIGGTCS